MTIRELLANRREPGRPHHYNPAAIVAMDHIIDPALAVVEAARDIADGRFIDQDGELGYEWCHWCESMDVARHAEWCPYPKLGAVVAAFDAAVEEATRP